MHVRLVTRSLSGFRLGQPVAAQQCALKWRALVKGDLEDWVGAIADFDVAEKLAPLGSRALERRLFAKEQLVMASSFDNAKVAAKRADV